MIELSTKNLAPIGLAVKIFIKCTKTNEYIKVYCVKNNFLKKICKKVSKCCQQCSKIWKQIIMN